MTEANTNKRAGAEAKIEISLSRLSQLFNSFDPSPFHERDLDPDAEEYIVGSAEEVARHGPLCLHLLTVAFYRAAHAAGPETCRPKPAL